MTEWKENTPPYTKNTNRFCNRCKQKSTCYVGKHAVVMACKDFDGKKQRTHKKKLIRRTRLTPSRTFLSCK